MLKKIFLLVQFTSPMKILLFIFLIGSTEENFFDNEFIQNETSIIFAQEEKSSLISKKLLDYYYHLSFVSNHCNVSVCVIFPSR